MLRLHSVRLLTRQHPSQWQARTDDDRPVYIRYKWGELSVSVGPVHGSDDLAVGGEKVIDIEFGDPHDCEIELGEVLTANGIELIEAA